jgi:predicted permease
VANLLIARAFARQKEIAVRLSLGSSRGRLVRQLLVESLVLSLAGGALGVGVAFALTRSLIAFIPSQEQPLLITPHPDARILAFTLVLTFLTGLVFGLLPALRASRPDPWTTLKDSMGSIAGTGGSLFLRKGLVTLQVALSFLLLFDAGLFVRSLQNLKPRTGVALDNLVRSSCRRLSGYESPRAARYDQLLDNLRAVPGMKSAALASVSILSGDEWDSSMSVEGHQAKDGEDMQAFMNALSPGYFQAMRIPLLEGRDFTPADPNPFNGDHPPSVAIVNRRFAAHFFPNQSAVGKHIGFGGGPGTKLNIEIIGVVADSLYEGPREGVHRQVFVPFWGKSSSVFYLRTQAASSATYSQIRNEVRQLDSAIPVYGMKTLQSQLDETLLTDRLIAMLSAGFGLLATLLASIGLYGVMAFVVARRKKELGIRLALGAPPAFVIWMVMREKVRAFFARHRPGDRHPVGDGVGRYVHAACGIQLPHDPAIAA